MATRTFLFLLAGAVVSLLGASARADDLPASDWVPVMEVVIAMERVGFTPIAKIEAKDGNWMVHAYRRSVLYEVRVDPHATSIKSVSAKSVTACGTPAATNAEEVNRKDTETSEAPLIKAPKAASSARKPAAVKPRREATPRQDEPRIKAPIARTPLKTAIPTVPTSKRKIVPYVVPRTRTVPGGFVGGPDHFRWYR